MRIYKYIFYWIYKSQKKKWDSKIVGINSAAMVITLLSWFTLIDIQALLIRMMFITTPIEPFPIGIIILCSIYILYLLHFSLKSNYRTIEAKYDDLPTEKHKKARICSLAIIVVILLGLFLI